MTRDDLSFALRLIVVTDDALAGPRGVEEVVGRSLLGGAPAIQLRDKGASARELVRQGLRLRDMTRQHGALLFINDRFDVALAVGADGVHLGPDDLPVGHVRRCAPEGFLIGSSTDDPHRARQLEAEGADYLGCGAVFGTRTKDVGDEAIGLHRLDEVARAVRIPVVGIGGVTAPGAWRVAAETAAAGVAVVGAVMSAPDPAEAVRDLLEPFSTY
jgi:thiamine-phosphate pyrophosphorylase